MAKKVIAVQQDDAHPVETKVLAGVIVEISASMKRLLATGLNRKAIVTLICADAVYDGKYDRRHPSREQVTCVLDSLDSLAETYCK